MPTDEAATLIATLERDPSQVPAYIATLEETIMRLMDRIAADPLAGDKLAYVAVPRGSEAQAEAAPAPWPRLSVHVVILPRFRVHL